MNDLEIIYEQLKDKYDLLLTNTFALDDKYTIDVPVLYGKAEHGRFHLYKEYDSSDEFVFSVEYAQPKAISTPPYIAKYTHWHPYAIEGAMDDVIAFMEGTHRFL